MIRQRMGRTRVSDTEDKLIFEEVRDGMVVAQVSQSPLPPRRPSETRSMWWGGKRYHLTIGLWPDSTRPAEVFISGAKAGSEMDHLLDDCCIAVSKLLQSGADPQELAATFGCQSIMGAVAAEVASLCQSHTVPIGIGN